MTHSNTCDNSAGMKSVIGQLNITADEMLALRIQVFVSSERRGDNRVIYKLRFRYRGRQHVRFFGRDQKLINRVKKELEGLQSAYRETLCLGAITRIANKELRDLNREFSPMLHRHGLQFHGLAIRRPQTTDKITDITRQ